MLLHDAQFLEGERPVAVDYGHATVEDSRQARPRVRRRHAWCCSTTRRSAPTPRWTRSAAWAPGLAGGLPVVVAREGMTLDVRRLQGSTGG